MADFIIEGPVLVTGSTGALGGELVNHLVSLNVECWLLGRFKTSIKEKVINFSDLESEKNSIPKFKNIVFCHGANASDAVTKLDFDIFNDVIDANVISIARCINNLFNLDKIERNGSITVISSIWQRISRDNKFSYCVSKSAIEGLVRSSSIDLGKYGIRVNAVLPGPVDTPMTRNNLTEAQLDRIISETPLNRLVKAEEIAKTAIMLMSNFSSGITGNFITVDGGMSDVRIY
jgi:NAD(P)-dependent dehydrogenase (short-subunit alcohol dehydrogenase family)